MRTFLIFVGGAIVAIVAEMIFGQWLTPDAGQVIVGAQNALGPSAPYCASRSGYAQRVR